VKTAEAPPSVSLRPIQAAFIACSPWPNHLIGRDSAACPGSGVAPSSAGAWTSARTIRWRARAPGSQSVSRSAGRNLARDWKWLVSIANVTHHASARYRTPLHDTGCGRGRSWWLPTIDCACQWWSLSTIVPHLHPTAGGPPGHPPFGAFFPPLFAVVQSSPGVVRLLQNLLAAGCKAGGCAILDRVGR
jgi:hypothetical protein